MLWHHQPMAQSHLQGGKESPLLLRAKGEEQSFKYFVIFCRCTALPHPVACSAKVSGAASAQLREAGGRRPRAARVRAEGRGRRAGGCAARPKGAGLRSQRPPRCPLPRRGRVAPGGRRRDTVSGTGHAAAPAGPAAPALRRRARPSVRCARADAAATRGGSARRRRRALPGCSVKALRPKIKNKK